MHLSVATSQQFDHTCGAGIIERTRNGLFIINVEVIQQEYVHTCGPATLEMLMKLFGFDITQAELEPLLTPDHQSGSLTTDMVRVLKSFGFQVIAKTRARIQDIYACLELGFPVAVNFIDEDNDGHFSVITGYYKHGNHDWIEYNDPAWGMKKRMLEEEFIKRWKAKYEKDVKQWMMAPLSRDLSNGVCHTLREGTCEQYKKFLDQLNK